MIQSVFRSIEISFKNLSEPLSSSIDRNCFSINRILWIRIKKKKNGSWLFQTHLFQKFSKFSLSLRFRLGSTSDFCCFLSFFLQGFFLQTPVRPFYPSFCFYFHISCILIWEFRTYKIFEVFDDSSRILCHWSMGFVDILLYSWSLLENLINLEIWEKSKFLGLVMNPI